MSPATRAFELKLPGGKVVVWEGRSGEDAAVQYELAHPGVRVAAWRAHPRRGLCIGVLPIVEPGDPRW